MFSTLQHLPNSGFARAGLVLGLVLAAGSQARAYRGEQFAKDAKLSLAQACAIALAAHPGKVSDQELEKEGGGSGLRYSFDILDGSKTYEVGVDVQSGKILENAAEGKNSD